MQSRTQLEAQLVEQLGPRLRAYFPARIEEHPAIWMSKVFTNLRCAIGNFDKVAMSLACEFIERDPMLPFGKLIKSGLARELRRNSSSLIASDRTKIVETTIRLLGLPYAPREVEDYIKLLKKLPRAEFASRATLLEPKNPKSLRLKAVLLAR